MINEPDSPSPVVEPAAPRDQKCIIGEYCRLHRFIHGAEAEELRERFEKLAKDLKPRSAEQVNRILEDVDARDSCAFLEAKTPPAACGAASQEPMEMTVDTRDLIHRLRSRAMVEAPQDNDGYDPEQDAGDDAEITWGELGEIAALLHEAADALKAHLPSEASAAVRPPEQGHVADVRCPKCGFNGGLRRIDASLWYCEMCQNDSTLQQIAALPVTPTQETPE